MTAVLLVLGFVMRVGAQVASAAPAAPTISVGADMVVGEADGHVDIPVTLNKTSTQTVSVDYATVTGSATSTNQSDYTAVAGTLQFAPGETSKTVPVAITDGSDVENLQSFFFTVSTPVNATIARASNMISIVDNDTVAATPQLVVRNSTVDESAGFAYVPVLLGGPLGTRSTSTVSVHYATADGTATAGNDYTAESGTLTFAPGQTVHNVAVPITDDSTTEGAERFTVKLTTPTNATIAHNTGVVTIGANDATAVASPRISAGPDLVVGEGDGYVDLTVGLNAPGTKPVSVDYTTTTGSATSTNQSDYLGVAGTLDFAPGETTKTVRVELTDGSDVENLQSFSLSLSNQVNATIARASEMVSIVDNDTIAATPQLAVRNATVDESAGVVNVPVLLGGPRGTRSNSTVTVNYATADGTATAGSDYTAASGKLTFAPGETVQNIVVPITDDSTPEGAERFTVTLSKPSNATIAHNTGVVTIGASDATAVASPAISTGPDLVVGEGDGYVDLAVTLNAPGTKSVSVDYTTATGSATSTNQSDYVVATGTLNFAPGETTKTVRVELTDGTDVENLQSFFLTIDTPVNATIARASEMVSIVDNEPVVATPALYVRNATVDESAGVMNVPVLLGGPHGTSSNSTVTVNYATVDGSATAGSDYTAESGKLTFAPGETVQNIVVPIADDSTTEAAEHFTVRLSKPTNATIGHKTGFMTIGASDAAAVARPRISAGSDVTVGEGDGYVDLTVGLNAPGTAPVSVDYATAIGTATSTNQSDYLGVSGTLVFAPGQTTKTVRVEIEDDASVEGLEYFNLNLSNALNGRIKRPSEKISITDND